MTKRIEITIQSTRGTEPVAILPHRGHQDTVSIRSHQASNGLSDDSKGGINEENWRTFANCRGIDTNLFFPVRGDSGGSIGKARALCLKCPVKRRCLVVALEQEPDSFGIFGGTTAKGRRVIRRMWKRNPDYLYTAEAEQKYGLKNAY